MICSGASTLAEPGMVLLLSRYFTMSLDHAMLFTESGSEALSRLAP